MGREESWLIRYAEGVAALASGVLIGTAWMMESASYSWAVALYLTAFVVGGFVKAKEGLHTLFIERDLDVNLLMIAAAIGAASIGYWTEGAVLIFIFSLSGALESYTMDRSRRDIAALMDLKPELARLVKDGMESMIAIEELEPGEWIAVRPGERIPADGKIVDGRSAVDQSSITGESVPVDKEREDEVYAGTLNGEGALVIQVSRASESTVFAKIIRLVQEAESEKPASQLFMERFERIYARAIIVVALLLILVPPLLLNLSWESALYQAMVFLVVASPCALVASIMPAVLSAISGSARKGLLFKGGAHLQNLARTRVVAFDKTGTLTQGRPNVTDYAAFGGYTDQELLRIAASIESLSEHPLAKAIVRKAKEEGLLLERPEDFRSDTGRGVQGRLEGNLWRIAKPTLVHEAVMTVELRTAIDQLEQEGKTVSVVYHEGGAAGVIALQDGIRAEAKQAIAALHKLGIQVAMLTGDQKQTAQAIAREAGIDLVYADLLPEDKVLKVKELRQRYGYVAMVGDGVNDAPALATASVGIAMGAAGSDAALEAANVVLLKDEIGRIAEAIRLGRKTMSVVKQNIGFALTVIILLIAANFAGHVPLPLGVLGHEGSTLLVILNGLRLLRPIQ
ncbi:heavy metal translocating P-type ATPase [Paenibacillus pinihumi]|uniref:heavy metal translocating P-type ATPase n=1 Tax=Paenibacillus pinihumi TaxID=669462 RepID=UPI0005631B87|nr:heavy metal translocating P-type ATPase [Paenibacillus pinihumi]